METQVYISLPQDLLVGSEHFIALVAARTITVEIPDSYLDLSEESWAMPEVVAIQRLLTIARMNIPVRVRWHKKLAERAFVSPNLFPLLAVVLCLDNAQHALIDKNGESKKVDVQSSRLLIYNYRPKADMFSDTQVLICADSRGHGRPKSLYSTKSSGLMAREDFESLVDRLLAGQAAINVSTSHAVVFSQNIATIVAELFENTDIHGRIGLDGAPFKVNGIRGLLFKRAKIAKKDIRSTGGPQQSGQASADGAKGEVSDALEISVFDSGIGFYSSYTKSMLTAETNLNEEWKIVHKCLERHYDKSIPSHTGMGLYEVLRALIFLKGSIEVRSGRTYGYRTFEEGAPKYQLESRESRERPGMPKPVLLDMEHKFVTVPYPNEPLVGASVRVLVPLH